MPQVPNGPKGLNSLLESVYSGCMKEHNDKGRCSATAWQAAKNAGWYRGKDGKWHKKSADAEINENGVVKMNRNKLKG
jgi:hypothetical protein